MDHQRAKTILISTIMHPPPIITARSFDSIYTISTSMKKNEVSSIIITDKNGKQIGIITERDIVRRTIADGKDPNTTKATNIMSQPLITVKANSNLFDAIEIMEKNNIRRLPIIKGNLIIGIVTVKDIIKYIHTENKDDHYFLKFMVRYRKYFEE